MNLLSYVFNYIFPEATDKIDIKQIELKALWKFNWVFSIFEYRSKKVRKLIKSAKYYKNPHFINYCSTAIYQELLESLSEKQSLGEYRKPLLCPIPSSRRRKWKHDHSYYFAKALAKEIPNSTLEKLLLKTKKTRKQALIPRKSERVSNVRGAFSLNRKYRGVIKNQDIIIVDDLVTSGATLSEAQKVLKRNGARNIIAICIAR